MYRFRVLGIGETEYPEKDGPAEVKRLRIITDGRDVHFRQFIDQDLFYLLYIFWLSQHDPHHVMSEPEEIRGHGAIFSIKFRPPGYAGGNDFFSFLFRYHPAAIFFGDFCTDRFVALHGLFISGQERGDDVIGDLLRRLSRIESRLGGNCKLSTLQLYFKSLDDLPTPDDTVLGDIVIDQILHIIHR